MHVVVDNCPVPVTGNDRLGSRVCLHTCIACMLASLVCLHRRRLDAFVLMFYFYMINHQHNDIFLTIYFSRCDVTLRSFPQALEKTTTKVFWTKWNESRPATRPGERMEEGVQRTGSNTVVTVLSNRNAWIQVHPVWYLLGCTMYFANPKYENGLDHSVNRRWYRRFFICLFFFFFCTLDSYVTTATTTINLDIDMIC
jgi:hypothetical protein